MNQPQYFEIQASQPKELVEFYKKAFDWTFEEQTGMPIEYWRITTSGIGGAILERPAQIPHAQQGTNAYVVSMEVADFDATADAILAAGGMVALPKFAIAGKCWQGYFLDVDQNTFGIFQADEAAA